MRWIESVIRVCQRVWRWEVDRGGLSVWKQSRGQASLADERMLELMSDARGWVRPLYR